MSINKAAVVGKPIGHSLSPVIHNRAYEVLGLDWHYGRFEVGEGELGSFLKNAPDEYRGFSVTMPLKGEAFALSAELDEYAVKSGAVNTLVRSGSGWNGFNTDVPGAVSAMQERGITALQQVAVLGAGATARSLMVAAAQLGAKHFDVWARRRAGFEELQNSLPDFDMSFHQLESDTVIDQDALDLLINTLPGNAADGISVSSTPALFDVTYAPWPTKLSSEFDSSAVVSGKDLLVHQAIRQLQLMTQVEIQDENQLLREIRLAISN